LKKHFKNKITLQISVFSNSKLETDLYIFIQIFNNPNFQMKPRYLFLILVFVGICTYKALIQNVQPYASFVFINGKIYTCDEYNSTAEAIAIQGTKILGVGTGKEILSRFKTQDTIDLNGKTVLPGFIDAHGHLLGLGDALQRLNLVGTTSLQQVIEMVKEKVQQENAWIFGRGWDQNDWEVKEFPTHKILDEVAGNKFIVLRRIDGHATWVNQNVLTLARITRDTPDPDGGKILRDENGNPTGILLDNAETLIQEVLPARTDEEIVHSLTLAVAECAKLGLTEVHDMGVDIKTLNAYVQLLNAGKLPIRVYAAIDGIGETWNFFLQNGPVIDYENKISIRAIKLYMDGALGSRGAALIAPYSDDPLNRGLTYMSEDSLRTLCVQALERGFQVCTHAIGDRANHIVLNAYEDVLKNNSSDVRFRVEHCQVLDTNDIPRFKKLGIIPSMQPSHATSDGWWAEQRIGNERIKGAYAWRTILNAHSIIPAGSDFPVESPNPLWGFFAAVTRAGRDNYPANGWYGNQKMTRDEAAKAFTIWGAYAAFQENWKGTIEGGKVADFTILSDDIMTISQEKILTTEVEMTIVGGKVVYRKQNLKQTN
jgi:predicted amidohydrolase YtcJ